MLKPMWQDTRNGMTQRWARRVTGWRPGHLSLDRLGQCALLAVLGCGAPSRVETDQSAAVTAPESVVAPGQVDEEAVVEERPPPTDDVRGATGRSSTVGVETEPGASVSPSPEVVAPAVAAQEELHGDEETGPDAVFPAPIAEQPALPTDGPDDNAEQPALPTDDRAQEREQGTGESVPPAPIAEQPPKPAPAEGRGRAQPPRALERAPLPIGVAYAPAPPPPSPEHPADPPADDPFDAYDPPEVISGSPGNKNYDPPEAIAGPPVAFDPRDPSQNPNFDPPELIAGPQPSRARR